MPTTPQSREAECGIHVGDEFWANMLLLPDAVFGEGGGFNIIKPHAIAISTIELSIRYCTLYMCVCFVGLG